MKKRVLGMMLMVASGALFAEDFVAVFNDLDENRDGYLSVDEARENRTLDRVFRDYDSDIDNRMSLDEYMNYLNAEGLKD
ncbi:MAG: EF-hand domain-containing protein [Gammaproteobacteria bacterium]|nr:EF-hand domain-containing protein [Gammaproteobacteria bacterium]